VRVAWRTEGKGDTDREEIHREELVVPVEEIPAQGIHLGFEAHLPATPLSYDGRIVKIRWAVEVRVRAQQEDTPGWLKLIKRLVPGNTVTKNFRLGKVQSPRELAQ
jgi:hypothetical protein